MITFNASEIEKKIIILPVEDHQQCCHHYLILSLQSFIIQAEKFRRFDWFRASLFPRNCGIAAKIDGITRLPCYTTAAVTAEAVIYELLSLNYFKLFALDGLYWFHKKLSIISSIDLKRLLRT